MPLDPLGFECDEVVEYTDPPEYTEETPTETAMVDECRWKRRYCANATEGFEYVDDVDEIEELPEDPEEPPAE